MLSITRHSLPWPGLTAPVRIAQLTDVHVGWSTPRGLVRDAVQAAGDQADVVVFTGDAVNLTHRPGRRFAELLAKVDRPKLGVLGNHDHYAGGHRIAAMLQDAGVQVLSNACTTVGELVIVGTDDGYTKRCDVDMAFAEVPVDARRDTLVLTHHPPDADEIARVGGRVILAGHTHGGQARLPGVARSLAEWWSGDPYVHGWYDVGPARLYVCAGLGHAPFRLGIAPELAIFTLEPA